MSDSNRYSSSSTGTNDCSSYLLNYRENLTHDAIPTDATSHASSTTVRYRSFTELIYDRLSPRRKNVNKSNSYPWTVLISFNLGVVACIVTGILLWKYLVIYRYTLMNNNNHFENCLQCISLLNETEKTLLSRKKVNGVEYCCVRSRNQLASLLEMMIEQKGTKSYPLAMRNVMSPPLHEAVGFVSANMQIGEVSSLKKHTGQNKKLLLRTLLKTNLGIGCNQDCFVIPQDGRYLINSQFYHKIRFDRQMRCKHMNILGHEVKRRNARLPNNQEETLLAGFYTVRCYRKKSDFYISHISGIFLLKSGDEISVSANGNTVSMDSYLAIIRIGSTKPN